MEKMSRPLPLNPTFIPPPYGVLRSLLENPLKLPLHHEDAYSKDKDKEKKLDDESNSPTVPQSAFLGPTLWDKTLPYDGDTFQLEYMDLEEFLSENGIPPSPSQHDHSPHPPGLQPTSSAAPSVMDLSSRASAPIHPGIPPPNCVQSPMRPGTPPRVQQAIVILTLTLAQEGRAPEGRSHAREACSAPRPSQTPSAQLPRGAVCSALLRWAGFLQAGSCQGAWQRLFSSARCLPDEKNSTVKTELGRAEERVGGGGKEGAEITSRSRAPEGETQQ
ncbi:hepatic leukemia factor isoform X2 [Muntiacus reevesi]|uniref:hepatic leukemia factor isoform X2 n=1 Tax=Muntiacus reevesi TaxID=9886 RepID=UPI003306C44F